ncbi:GSCFA family protein [Pelagimonas phthalicica]|uniref:GSCFA family protein n=1 Tax=Pelagimonas phthalicica TaxID=1037362 RepID=A0A238JGB1_9RHOB|nr:GSCFA domain-containing protein [Pelagimonas phthalicica]TDS89105.1 GSCFA family protein [Pelagimonas phthalicica]SMX29720.1 GSCFA family protein [Pelagimonas phthalicica]
MIISPIAGSQNGAEALAETLRNPMRKYPDRSDARFEDHLILPSVAPGFKIDASSSVFTIGSCFARNVEEALIERGVSVPTASFSAAQDKIPGRPNRVLNQYNPGTMLQCVENVFGKKIEGGIYDAGRDKLKKQYVDSLLSTGGAPTSLNRVNERRAEIDQLYTDGLAASETVVITLGLIESWLDLEAGIYLNEMPPAKLVRSNASQFEFRRLGVSECERLVSAMVELLNRDKRRNIVLTVSPVPLQVTFAGGDATTANGFSKAVLRVVAETVSNNFDMVDYFPSYEAVTTSGFRSFGEDNVHVRPATVQRVVNHMVDQYLEGAA